MSDPRGRRERARARRGGCPSGKVRYRDGQEAKRALSTVVRLGDARDAKPSRAYDCPTCHGWHLSSHGG